MSSPILVVLGLSAVQNKSPASDVVNDDGTGPRTAQTRIRLKIIFFFKSTFPVYLLRDYVNY